MIASRISEEAEVPEVKVRCKAPGAPWFVMLSGRHLPDIELGPYENPAVAREDATKLRQFLAAMIQNLAKRPAEPSELTWLGTEPQIRDGFMNTAANRKDAVVIISAAIRTVQDREMEGATESVLK